MVKKTLKKRWTGKERKDKEEKRKKKWSNKEKGIRLKIRWTYVDENSKAKRGTIGGDKKREREREKGEAETMDTRRRRRGRFLLFSLFSFTRNTLSRFSFRKIDPRCRLLPDLERSKGPRKSVERRGEKEKRKTLLLEGVKERVTIIKYRGEWLDLVGNKVR